MPARLWKPNPTKLRELREARGHSQRDLADLASVNAETIADIESGKRRGVRIRTLRRLATILFVEWDQLLSNQERTRKDRGEKRLAHELVPDCALDLQAFVETEKPEPKLETRFGALEAFGAVEMVDTIAAPRTREGDRYYVFGEVGRQRPVDALDEIMLGLPRLECARFEFLRRLDPDLEPFPVTVFTRSVEQTRTLQKRFRSGKLAYVVVHVVVVLQRADDAEHVFVTNLDGGERIPRARMVAGRAWGGFQMIASQSRYAAEKPGPIREPQSWTLVVEEVIAGEVDRIPPSKRYQQE
jgi:transcriptional regulator with XRE-family HTH domain